MIPSELTQEGQRKIEASIRHFRRGEFDIQLDDWIPGQAIYVDHRGVMVGMWNSNTDLFFDVWALALRLDRCGKPRLGHGVSSELVVFFTP